MAQENRCVCCGAVIPEGFQVCRACAKASCCGNCAYRSDDFTSACTNDQSLWRGDFVSRDGWCTGWTKRKERKA